MENFLIGLIGGGFGVVAVTVFLPSAKLRRSLKESFGVALAAIAGAGLAGFVAGAGTAGVPTGLGLAIAITLTPVAVLAVRDARVLSQDGSS